MVAALDPRKLGMTVDDSSAADYAPASIDKQGAQGFAVGHSVDAFPDQSSHRKHTNLRAFSRLRPERDGIGDNQFIKHRPGDVLDRGT